MSSPIDQQSQQYSMELGGAKQFVLGDRNRTTMFPSLKKSFYKPKSINGRELNDYSLDEKAYRMTSNQLLKGILRQNDSEIKKLRTTFMRPNGIEERGKKKIGQYEIIKEIGKGGFAQVYEVEDANHNKYALKEYNLQNAGECFQNESAMGQFFFERGAVREQFSHHPGSSHLIRFVDKFRIGKYGYIIQELCEHNLSKLVSDIQGVFHNNERIYEVRFKEFYRELTSKNHLKKVMIELCQTIQLINRAGFIHCDLKLQNIMVEIKSDVPTVKVIDFGSTFELEYGLPKITITPEYMPPELLIMLENGSNDYDSLHKVDVWSIGCILLQILTGIPLWFRYKCRVEVKGKPTVALGFFALTGRQYHKIVKKQRQMCDNISKIAFTCKQLQKYRPLLKKLLMFNHNNRAGLDQCVQMLKELE